MADHHSQWTDRELDEALHALAHRVRYPVTPDIASAVRERIEAQPRPSHILRWRPGRLVAVAVALVALIAGAALAFPDTRATVAGWFNLPGVVLFVETTDEQPAPGGALRLGDPTTLDEAHAQTLFPVLVPSLDWLREPAEVYLDVEPAGGAVSFVYHPTNELPEAEETGVGLLLSQFQGELNHAMYGKGVPPGVRVETFEINDQIAYWISGDPHYFWYRDPDGKTVQETVRLAGNTLLWQQDGLTLRLESALDRDAALAIAESMR